MGFHIHFRLSNISVKSTQILLFSSSASFIHFLLAVIHYAYQVSVFSIFTIIVYWSLKNNLCTFHMKTLLSSPFGLGMSKYVARRFISRHL